MKLWWNLSVGAPARLQALRQAFAAHPALYPHCPELAKPKSWRGMRETSFKSVEAYCGCLSQGFNTGGARRYPVWYTHQGEYFRREEDCGDARRGQRHSGWYTDPDQDELAIGIIARLPHNRFIAGYRWTGNGERVWFPEIYRPGPRDADDPAQAIHDAAMAADEHARVFAEEEREYRERQRELDDKGQEIQDQDASVQDAEVRICELLALRHHPRFREGMAGKIAAAVVRLRGLRNTRQLQADALERLEALYGMEACHG